MPSDYADIKDENLRRYGTDIDRIGPMLLADRYDNRAHFIYELLQNAEDALRRRGDSGGPRSIGFRLYANELRVSHFGRPFDEADIRGICGIGQSTKPAELTAIGRFGIGFKSVYAFTAAPEVHSGTEHFAIDSFVWPRAVSPRPTRPGETLFVFPFRPSDAPAHSEIAVGLKTLGARTLLFLKDIEEVSWTVDGGASGIYLRGEPEQLAPCARRVALLGQDSEAPDTEESWIIFARDVFAPDGSPAGQVEIAFALEAKQPGTFSVRRVPASTLVVFFPTIVPTNCGFPTVRQSIANHPDARKFLAQLGLTEPDPVDDVVANVLPRYQTALVALSEEQYSADIRRILAAFGTDSKAQRDKLIAALRDAFFVMAIDSGSGATSIAKPGDVYMATDRLTDLFRGVPGVRLVNDSYSCLRGEDMRKLLDACGAAQYLQPLETPPGFTPEQRREMRREAGQERCSSENSIRDWTLRGLQQLLAALPGMDADSRRLRSSLLWKALADVENRRGSSTFVGEYAWFFHTRYSTSFDAMFVRQLNDARWIPDANGEQQQPGVILFESLGWDSEPFLLTKIRFKPPIIDTLAKEAGLEPGLLDLLKKLGVTSEDELKARLKLADESEVPVPTPPSDGVESHEPAPASTEGVPPPEASDPAEDQSSGGARESAGPSNNGAASNGGARQGHSGSATQEAAGDGRRHEPDFQPERNGSASGTRTFHSYVGVHSDEHEPDPDGLTREARMSLEETAILAILAEEPTLLRTPTNNPGFDLIGPGAREQPDRRIEVKAMTRDLNSRPVGMSHAQFECAREHGAGFWLYVVEFADNPSLRRIVRIQNPAGNARTFTFDRGWIEIATASPPIAAPSQ